MEVKVVVLHHEKDTKNKSVYKEQPGTVPVVGHLYIEKDAVGPECPDFIRVRIEPVEAPA